MVYSIVFFVLVLLLGNGSQRFSRADKMPSVAKWKENVILDTGGQPAASTSASVHPGVQLGCSTADGRPRLLSESNVSHGTHRGLLHEVQMFSLKILRQSLTGTLLQTPNILNRTAPGNMGEPTPFKMSLRNTGLDWPMYGLSMAGNIRLHNIQELWLKVVFILPLMSNAYWICAHANVYRR